MKPTPLIIVTGYLGAGKTTLVRQLVPTLENKSLKGLLIVNEVGDVNVDGASLGDSALEQTELLGGCACCSLRGDLYNALLEGIEQFAPDYILLETSGLAEPSELLDAATAPRLRGKLEVSDILTIVDAVNLARQLKRGQLARMQCSFASSLALNKCDIASSSEIEAARSSLAEVAPEATVFEGSHGEFDIEGLLARTLTFIEGEENPSLRPLTEGASQGHTHSHDAFFALSIDLPEQVDVQALKEALRGLPEKVYRVKGFAGVKGSSRPWIFQRVGDQPPQATEFALEGVDVPIGMVLIGANLHAEDVTKVIEPLGGVVRVVTK